MARLDTKLEQEGAEFLVLGHLLIEGIQAFKTYTNFPGYDLVATDPDANRSCRIQVKSRWATDFDGGFPIRNFDCDFVVFVALNRGFRHHKKATKDDDGRRDPQMYVVPVNIVIDAQKPDNSWGKVFLRHVDDVDQYIDNWQLVRDFLSSSNLSTRHHP